MDDYPAAEPIPSMTNYGVLMDYLKDNDGFRETARNSLQQGLWSGGGAVAGGLLAGPLGGLVGGVAGSVVGFFQSDPYDGLLQQLGQLPAHQQKSLLNSVASILKEAGSTASVEGLLSSPQDLQRNLVELAARRDVRDQVWAACMDAMKQD